MVAAAPPTVTLVAPVKFVPTMVMAVAPFIEPEFGLTEVIVGAPIKRQPVSELLGGESPALVMATTT